MDLAPNEAAYFNCVDTEENVELSFVPRPFTTAMMATAMPAAIRPYSMAVAADSSFRNTWNLARMGSVLAAAFETTVRLIFEKEPRPPVGSGWRRPGPGQRGRPVPTPSQARR